MSIYAGFSLPVTAFPPGSLLGNDADYTIELERVVPTGSVTHYLWVVDEDVERVVDDVRRDRSVESVTVLDELPDRSLVRIRWQDVETPVLDLIEDHGAMLVDATGTGDGWTVSLRFPDQDAIAAFYEASRQRGIALELLGVDQTGLRNRDSVYGLTPAQREAVVAAFEAGYFDVPRRTTITELAERLGVSEQALSERLRRGLRQYLSATVGDDDAPRSDDAADDDRSAGT